VATLALRSRRASLLAAVVIAFSKYGTALKQFMADSRVELRKIVWPNRQETGHDHAGGVRLPARRRRFLLGLDLALAWATRALTDKGLTVALRWYVVHAYSTSSTAWQESLKERIRRAGLEAKFGEILVPTEEVVEMRDGVKRKSERKFYPAIVLVQMEMDEDTWHLVRDVPKCSASSVARRRSPLPSRTRKRCRFCVA